MGYSLEFYNLNWADLLAALGSADPGLRPAGTAEDSGREVTSALALAFAALIRERGEFIGRLQHSSSSGQTFREQFLTQSAPKALGTRLPLLELLTMRPLCGLQHKIYPSWGGLTKSEIQELMRNVHVRDLPTLGDSDEDSWLYDLCDALAYARQAGRDIVSLYL